MKKFKKIFLIFLLTVFLGFVVSGFCLAQKLLEVEYPPLPGVEKPITTKTGLSDYLIYLFNFSIIIAGLIAFAAMVYGGVKYLTSAGAPAKLADARDQIMAGILGMIIILASYLILTTLNPQLVKMAITPPTGAAGIKIYTSDNCDENATATLKVIEDIENLYSVDEKGNVVINWGTDGMHKIESIKFLSESEKLTVKIYQSSTTDHEFTGDFYCYGKAEECAGAISSPPGGDYSQGDCKSDFVPGNPHRSIKLEWRIPGVHLYASTNCTGESKVYQASAAKLGDFNDKAKSIKFIYDATTTAEAKFKYAAILHEHENFRGRAMVFYHDQDEGCKSLSANPLGVGPTNIGVSSLTVYLKPVGAPIGNGVRFWDRTNYSGCALPAPTTIPGDPCLSGKSWYGDDDRKANLSSVYRCGYVGDACKWPKYKTENNITTCENTDGCNDMVTSIEMDGPYIAILFDGANYDGKCEVFTESDSNLRDNTIGQCGWFGRSDCLSSFIIKARK